MKRKNDAVTPVIGTILILMIVFSAIGAIYSWGLPYIEHMRMQSAQQSVYNQFSVWDESLTDLLYEGIGATRVNNIAIAQGSINIGSEGERLVTFYSLNPSYDFVLSDFDDSDNKKFTITALVDEPEAIIKVHIFWLDKDKNGWKFFSVKNEGDFAIIETTYPLAGMIRMDFYNDTAVIGIGWLFDTGCLSYRAPSSFGTYGLTAENNGIVAITPTGNYLKKKPMIFNTTEELFMRAILIRSGIYCSGGSGPGTYRFITRLNSSSILEDSTVVYNLKVQIYGDYADLWLQYFNDHAFKNFPDVSNTLRYPNDRLKLSFIQSLFVVDLKGIK